MSYFKKNKLILLFFCLMNYLAGQKGDFFSFEKDYLRI